MKKTKLIVAALTIGFVLTSSAFKAYFATPTGDYFVIDGGTLNGSNTAKTYDLVDINVLKANPDVTLDCETAQVACTKDIMSGSIPSSGVTYSTYCGVSNARLQFSIPLAQTQIVFATQDMGFFVCNNGGELR